MLETGTPLTFAYAAGVRSSAGRQRTLWLACIVLLASSCGGRVSDWTASDRGGTAAADKPPPAPAAGLRPAAGPPPAAPSTATRSGNPNLPGQSQVPEQENCADNPLLAGCATLTPAPIPVPAEPPSVPTDSAGVASQILQVESVLAERCGNCHGGEPTPKRCGTCDGMFYVEDLRRLIQAGYVFPCDWASSRLSRRIEDGSMPPPSSGQGGLTRQELRLVRNFVDGLCADLTEGGPRDTQRTEIESWLTADCGSCHGPANGGEGAAARGPLEPWDIGALLEAGQIVPCNAEGSPLVQVLRDDSMPPPGANPRPSRSQLRELISFIERPCSPR